MGNLAVQLNDLYFVALLSACALSLHQQDNHAAPIYQILESSRSNNDTNNNQQANGISERDRLNCFLSFIGLFVDYYILYSHYSKTFPHHPRFYLYRKGSFFMLLHLASVAIQVFCLFLALFVQEYTTLSQAAALAALGGHAVSALYHTPGSSCCTIGSSSSSSNNNNNNSNNKRISVLVGYAIMIGLHTMTAWELWCDPANVHKLILLNCTLHGYAWVRVNMAMFEWFNLFANDDNDNDDNCRYMVALSWAIFMTLSCFGSPTYTWTLGGGGLLLGCGIAKLVLRSKTTSIAAMFPDWIWVDEKDSQNTMNNLRLDIARKIMSTNNNLASSLSNWNKLSDRDQALQVFQHFDTDHSGEIEIEKAACFLQGVGLPSQKTVAKEYIGKFDIRSSGKLSFDDFYDLLWTTDNIKERLTVDFALMLLEDIPEWDASDWTKCRCIFNLIDINQNGVVSVAQLSALLHGWDVPFALQKAKLLVEHTTKPGLMEVAEFFKDAESIWRYAYHNMRTEWDAIIFQHQDAQSRESFLDPTCAAVRRRNSVCDRGGFAKVKNSCCLMREKPVTKSKLKDDLAGESFLMDFSVVESVAPENMIDVDDDETEASSVMEYASDVSLRSQTSLGGEGSFSMRHSENESDPPLEERPRMQRQLGMRPHGGFATSRRASARTFFPTISETGDGYTKS